MSKGVGDWEEKGGGLQPTTSTSHFLTAAVKFSFLAVALSLFSTLMSALPFFFLLSKRPRGHVIYH